MKSLLTIFCSMLLFSSSTAFASTLAAEPTLPPDIETAWEKKGPINCTMYPGKSIVGIQYKQKTQDSVRNIIIFSINGRIIDHREWSRVGKAPATQIRYVKNSAENSWYKYTASEEDEAASRMRAELGLTSEEITSCNKQ